MCQHAYEEKAYRSYGANLPGYAQGAVFPGDNCPKYTKSEWLYPGCIVSALNDYPFYKEEDVVFTCPECDAQYTFDQLPRAYANAFSALSKESNVVLERALEAEARENDYRDKIQAIVRMVQWWDDSGLA